DRRRPRHLAHAAARPHPAEHAGGRGADPARRGMTRAGRAAPAGDERPRTGLGALAPGETPTAAALWQALGGVRGLLESILPGLAFLILYAVTKDTWLSVIPPVGIAAVFLAIRAVQRQSPLGALGGFLI